LDLFHSFHARVYLALTSVRDREEGQAMVEYALILFLVSIVSIAVLTTLGTKVSSVFNEINNSI
jgi:pilus assembly protein Flp/PilA